MDKLGSAPIPEPRDGREREGSEGTPVPPLTADTEREGSEGTPVPPLTEGTEIEGKYPKPVVPAPKLSDGKDPLPSAPARAEELDPLGLPSPYCCRFSSGAVNAQVANAKAAAVREYLIVKRHLGLAGAGKRE